jgi:hypothetical protein
MASARERWALPNPLDPSWKPRPHTLDQYVDEEDIARVVVKINAAQTRPDDAESTHGKTVAEANAAATDRVDDNIVVQKLLADFEAEREQLTADANASDASEADK